MQASSHLTPVTSEPSPQSALRRFLKLFRPSHQHTAFSATILLITTIMLSRLVGFLREMYIAWAFGATKITDAYLAGFTIPDWVNYLAAGGTASITFISIYTRFLAEKREEDAQKTFSVVITVMSVVLGVGILLAEIFAPQLNRLMFGKFNPEEFALCVHICRILLPAQLFFYVGGVAAAVLQTRRMFLLPALGPLFGAGLRWRRRVLPGNFSDQCDRRGPSRDPLPDFFRYRKSGLSGMDSAFSAADAGRIAGDRG